jgi:hypothetical protein
MKIPRTGKPSPRPTLLTLGTAIVVCVLASCEGRTYNKWVEEARVTSPDDRFDAVITREESPGGAMGNLYWNVFIVPKGAAVPKDEKHTLFTADSLRGEKLVWTRKHLLDIHYDFAEIDGFRNNWGENEVKDRGWREGDYLVEVRLVPSSLDFSLLTPNGDIKPKE